MGTRFRVGRRRRLRNGEVSSDRQSSYLFEPNGPRHRPHHAYSRGQRDVSFQSQLCRLLISWYILLSWTWIWAADALSTLANLVKATLTFGIVFFFCPFIKGGFVSAIFILECSDFFSTTLDMHIYIYIYIYICHFMYTIANEATFQGDR